MLKVRTIALFLAATASAALAQTGLATLTGIVTDPAGAVVPGVTIRATHRETGTVLSAVASSTGNYILTQMPIGGYTLTVEAAGFKTYRREGLTLAAAQVLGLDVALEIGATTDSVTVNAEASLLTTEEASIAHNVTVSQMQNLPLLPLNGGVGSIAAFGFRDPYGLAQLIPGVQYSVNSVMVIDGKSTNSVQYRIEGQNSGLTGNLGIFTQFTQPSTDAVEEVAVQTSNFAPEFGSVGGGIFNVTMKSGTNGLHGSAYDYAVNEVLNAHQSFTHLRDADHRHDFGMTIGGPVTLPKIYNGKNKTFFFFSFEQFRTQPLVTTVSATVPTQAYRNGDFSALIPASGVNGVGRPLLVGSGASQHAYVDPLGATVLAGTIFDPYSTKSVTCGAGNPDCPAGSVLQYRSPFPNNAIPQVAPYVDPVFAKVQGLIPLPVGPNASAGALGNNFQSPFHSQRVSTLPSVKMDHNLTARSRLSFYWSYDETNAQYTPGNGAFEGFPPTITAARGTFHNSTQTRLNYDNTLSPTRVLHVGFGFVRFDFKDFSPTLDYNAQQSLGLTGATLNRLFPNFVSGSSATVGGFSTTGAAAQTTLGSERRPSATVSMTEVRGNHAVKYGAEWGEPRYPASVFTNTAGNYAFTSVVAGIAAPTGSGVTAQPALQPVTLSQGNTGFGYANFMLGGVQAVDVAVPAVYRTHRYEFALYVQDTWKVSRKLTLDYGLRWDYGTYNKEDYGRLGDLSLITPNPSAAGLPGGLVYEANCNCSFAHNYPFAFGPRLGAAYQVNSKTVLRGGVGVVYDHPQWFGAGITNDATGGAPGFGQQIFQLSSGIPFSISPQWPVYNAAIGQSPNTVIGAPALIDPNAGRPARQLQWQLSLQREISRNLVVEASYVGNRTTWAPAAALSSFNDISPALLAKYGFNVGDPNDRALLLSQVGNLTTAQKNTLAGKGFILPWASFPGSQTVRQAIRPFPQYNTSINPTAAPLGKTWYDALQVTLTKRYSHGLTLNGNYTFSKALDLLSSPDVFNPGLGKNLSANDLPHQFRFSAEYQTPRARKGLPVIGNPVVSYALGGWGLGVYAQYQSAPILGRPAAGSAQPISDWLGRGPGGAQLIAGMSPYAVNWTDLSGKVHPEPLDINCHCYDPTKTDVLNPLAWAPVPNGQWAADQSSIRYYRGIRQPNESANLSRNFRFKERYSLQIRLEVNNVFNRLRLPQPSSGGANFSAVPTSAGGLYTGGFGTFGNLQTGAAAPAPARSGLLVARFQF
ncbi:MAG: TonB-dependent receptor [Acidobacteriia bacterium]|nr:TonB-dependent receptor [Terriglobia bacterium]